MSERAAGPNVTVSSLVCHAHVAMAIDCLRSLVRLCDAPVRFQIHDDGTLTADDCARLGAIGEVRIIGREEADERMESELGTFPAARRFRSESPLALKLLDTVFFHPGPDYAFCDSDVLFLRPFRNPFCLNGTQTNAVFMEDRENSYSVRSWRLLLEPRIVLPSRVNTGIVCLRKPAYDPELLDWFLSRRSGWGVPMLREQTAWALLGMRVGCRKFDTRQVRVMREGDPDAGLVAGHFTARSRGLLPRYTARSMSAAGLVNGSKLEPVRLETVAGGRCGPWTVAAYEGRRLLRRAVHRR
jgi:hypothetical protein